jgi:uncharacterized protein (TIGR02266 family)
MQEERRQARRARPPGVLVTFVSSAGARVEAHVVDLAPGGLFIRTEEPLAAGDRLLLEIFAAGEPAGWSAAGRVVWTRGAGSTDGPPGMGVKLVDIDSAVADSLVRLVEARLTVEATTFDPHDAPTKMTEIPQLVVTKEVRVDTAPPISLPPVRPPVVSVAIDLVTPATSAAIDLVTRKPEPTPEDSAPLPRIPRRSGGRWFLFVLLVLALAAATLYVERDHFPWVQRVLGKQ